MYVFEVEALILLTPDHAAQTRRIGANQGKETPEVTSSKKERLQLAGITESYFRNK